MRKQNSFDSADIVLAVCIVGGFMTGNWIPAWMFGVVITMAVWHSTKV